MKAKHVLVATIPAFFTCATALPAPEPAASSRPSIDFRYVRTLFRVALDIQAGDTPLVIPVCGTDVELLCGAKLEVLSSQRWVSAPTPRDGPILGGFSVDRAKASVVQPHSSTRFVYQFAKHVFELSKGQQLRVVVNAWPDEVTMRANGPSIRIEGPTFQLP